MENTPLKASAMEKHRSGLWPYRGRIQGRLLSIIVVACAGIAIIRVTATLFIAVVTQD